MKYLTRKIDESMFFQRKTYTLFDSSVKQKVTELVSEIQKSIFEIHEPKCNFDVEMAMDIIDDAEKLTAIMLFSGDSDMRAPLERLKVKGKRVAVAGVRGCVASELHDIKDKYVDFGKFYSGKRTYS